MCAEKIDADRVEWGRRYEVAIRRFLRKEGSGSLRPAARLGRQAADLGMETLTVVNIHEQALQSAPMPTGAHADDRRDLIERADTFFKETIVPIEESHAAARKADLHINRLEDALRERTTALSAADEQLEEAIARREAAEATADARSVRHRDLLAEAERTQTSLRNQMRGLLSQQECDRKKIGAELRNEIAQALLAIDLCLLTLKRTGRLDADRTEKTIADAQRVLRHFTRYGQGSGEG